MKGPMRGLLLLPLALLALVATVPLATAAAAEEAEESALVEEALEECEGEPLCEEEVEAEEAAAEASYPPQCVLRSAKAHAVLRKSRLKVTIGYTTSEPTKAHVDLHYGATRLGQFKRRLRRSGVIRLTAALRGKREAQRLPLRVELDVEGAQCPTRRLVLVPKR
jgi:hypothetical protein